MTLSKNILSVIKAPIHSRNMCKNKKCPEKTGHSNLCIKISFAKKMKKEQRN